MAEDGLHSVHSTTTGKTGSRAIEAGFPASSKAEKETVTAIKKLDLGSVICGLARSVKGDVDTCFDCNVDMVHVFIPTSDIQRENTINKSRKEVLEITADIIGYIRRRSDLCMFSAMDATRTDWDYLMKVFQTAADAGATIINVPDTVGVISPSAMKTLITRINRERMLAFARAVRDGAQVISSKLGYSAQGTGGGSGTAASA